MQFNGICRDVACNVPDGMDVACNVPTINNLLTFPVNPTIV